MRVFVSHSSQDNQFCSQLVEGLSNAGADVWYDQKNLESGNLMSVITQELVARPAFVVILSKAAFHSTWVTQECQWAYNLSQREPERVILPVTAQRFDASDFNNWLYMEGFKRIEQSGGNPLPADEAVAKALHALDLGTESAVSASHMAQAQHGKGKTVLWVDDIPSNNYYERRFLERHGLDVTISLSTDDALGKLVQHKYDAIVSDMGRPGDNMAGYTLLEWVQKIKVETPFILYTSSNHPDHIAEARRRGAFGMTNSPDDLVKLVEQAISVR